MGKLVVPATVLRRIRRSLRDIDNPRSCIVFTLSKRELQQLGDDIVVFLANYAEEYMRHGSPISPEPQGLRDFLTDKTYVDTDRAVFRVPLKDLVEKQILSKEKVNGLTYWTLQGEVLDPEEYMDLYRLSTDTVGTLMYRMGLGEIYEEYRDSIVESGFRCICSIRVADTTIHIWDKDNFTAEYTHVVGKTSTKPRIIGVVKILVESMKPSRRNIEETLRYIDYTKLLVDEVVANLVDYIAGIDGVEHPISVSGTVTISQFRISYLRIRASREKRDKNTGRQIVVEVVGGKKDIPVIEVLLEYMVRSYSLALILETMKSKLMLPPGFSLSISEYDSVMRYLAIMKGTTPSHGIEKYYEIIKHGDIVFLNLVEEYLREDPRGKKILEALGWRRGQDPDTILLKLAVLKLGFHGAGREVEEVERALKVYTMLEGHGDILGKALNPYAVLLEFICDGKLVVNNDSILFKGRELRKIIPGLPDHFKEELWKVLSLKAPGYRTMGYEQRESEKEKTRIKY